MTIMTTRRKRNMNVSYTLKRLGRLVPEVPAQPDAHDPGIGQNSPKVCILISDSRLPGTYSTFSAHTGSNSILLLKWFPLQGVVWQMDGRYIYKHIPNSRKLNLAYPANSGIPRVLLTINSEGRRGATLSEKRPRIMVYGDSFIVSENTPLPETFV